MSIEMNDEIKRWTAKRKSALVMEIIQGKQTVAEASRAFDLPPSEIEDWLDQAKAGDLSPGNRSTVNVRFPLRLP